MLRILTSLVFVLAFIHLQAQDHQLYLTGGTQTPPANLDTYLRTVEIGADEVFDGYYLRLVQFETLPTAAQHRAIAAAGVHLLDYLPRNAYLTAFPEDFALELLNTWNVRHVRRVETTLKADPRILTDALLPHAVAKGQVNARIRFPEYLEGEQVIAALAARNIAVVRHNAYTQHVQVRFATARVREVADLPFVQYLDLVPEPGEPEDLAARALHRANQIDTDLPGPRQYDGTGVSVCVRDDGAIGPHIDFKGRLDQSYNLPSSGTHGDMVAGVAAGGGNLDPDIRGAATGSYVYTLDYEADFAADATMTLVMEEDVVLTNSSYSDGCNAGYNLSSITVDEQVAENSQLMHVFSAGNSNNNNCGYGAGDQWGNITGGHKQGKNVIATGNLDYLANLRSSSSRGPAEDGRIKPDICSNGHNQLSTDPDNTYAPGGGTSAASPGIMGTLAQLYQAYRELTGEANPPSGLLKAILLNTAYDMGTYGPDFTYGWGRVDALAALETLEDQRYLSAEITQGESTTHTITVPDGVAELRVMTYWTDAPGSANAAFALVNNLDTELTTPDGAVRLPLVLNSAPNVNTLDDPAEEGYDGLNNMEQVRVVAPIAGDYILQVLGTEVPSAAQGYFVVYEFVSDEIEITHPIGGEHYLPGASIPVHWNAYDNTTGFFVEYSLDNGVSWLPAGSNVSADERQVDFTMPNVTTGSGRIRITRDGQTTMSSAPFSIAPRPDNISFPILCPETITIAWDPVPGATAYDVFMLGATHMDSVGTSATNSIVVPIGSPVDENWFAVRARGGDADAPWIGQRTLAERQPAGLINCAQDNDLSATGTNLGLDGQLQVCGDAEQTLMLDITNTGLNDQPMLTANYQVAGSPVVSEPVAVPLAAGDSYQHTFATPISIDQTSLEVAAWVSTPLDSVSFNDTLRYDLAVILFDNPVAFDVVQTFESDDLQDGWTSFNPDELFGWEITPADADVIGADGSPTRAVYVNNYSYDTDGAEDYLTSTLYDLTTVDDPLLAFDVAYAPFSATYNDALRVEISGDCGTTFETIYEKAYQELQTTDGNRTSVFIPQNADEWRRELVDVAAYAGMEVIVRFVNISGYGNTLLLDNINFTQLLPPTVTLTTTATDVCEGDVVLINAATTGEGADFDWQLDTGTSGSVDANGAALSFSPGTHEVQYIITNPAGADTARLTFEVAPLPTAAFSTDSPDGITYTFTNASSESTEQLWNFGDGTLNVESNPTHTYTANGTYTVTLEAVNDCGVDATSIEIVVDQLTSSRDLPELSWRASVQPNPSSGQFSLVVEHTEALTLRYQLRDLQGRSLRSGSFVTPGVLPFEARALSPGMYLLQLTDQQRHRTVKVVIE